MNEPTKKLATNGQARLSLNGISITTPTIEVRPIEFRSDDDPATEFETEPGIEISFGAGDGKVALASWVVDWLFRATLEFSDRAEIKIEYVRKEDEHQCRCQECGLAFEPNIGPTVSLAELLEHERDQRRKKTLDSIDPGLRGRIGQIFEDADANPETGVAYGDLEP